MKLRLIFIICFELLGIRAKAQQNTFIDSLLQQDTLLNQDVLAHPETYKLQIIYTQINRDSLLTLTMRHPKSNSKTFHQKAEQLIYVLQLLTLSLSV